MAAKAGLKHAVTRQAVPGRLWTGS